MENKKEEQKKGIESTVPKGKKSKEELLMLGNLNSSQLDPQEELRKLLIHNMELTRENYLILLKVKKFITYSYVMSIVRLILLLIPLVIIILGFIYLPPILANAYNQYNELLGVEQSLKTNLNLQNIDLNQLQNQIKGMIAE